MLSSPFTQVKTVAYRGTGICPKTHGQQTLEQGGKARAVRIQPVTLTQSAPLPALGENSGEEARRTGLLLAPFSLFQEPPPSQLPILVLFSAKTGVNKAPFISAMDPDGH